MSFVHRHLLGIEALSPVDITTILDLAEQYVTLNRSARKHSDALAGLTQINMFFLRIRPAPWPASSWQASGSAPM